jgi:hypothetical protein
MADGSLCSWTLLTATTLWRFDAVSGSHPPQQLWGPTPRGLVWITNGYRARKLPVASALLIGRDLAQIIFSVKDCQKRINARGV